MTSARTLLLIADMGGYTDYMRTHRMSLAHAEVNTARLLETVIDAAPDFELIEIEGDAAFLALPTEALDGDAVVERTLEVAVEMHRAFHVERQYVATNLCLCKGCNEVDALKLKFVAHVGEVAHQTIRDRTKLIGIDVIHVHRLLKNPVTMPEYVLLSEDLYRSSGTPSTTPTQEIEQELEGVGPARSYVMDVQALASSLPPLPEPSLRGRVGRTLSVASVGMPYMLGLRRRRHRMAAAA